MKRAKRLKTKGIYFLYRVLQAFGLPVLLLYFLFRGLRNRGYWRSLPQRFGFLPRSFRQTGPGAIWLHAVSVGEVLACLELLRAAARGVSRDARFSSPPSTLAGRATAGREAGGPGGRRLLRAGGLRLRGAARAAALQPSVVVVAETEIWPNLFREVKRTGAGLAIVNGRISDRAFPRYRRLRWFFAAVLPARGCHPGADRGDPRALPRAGRAARADRAPPAISSTISRRARLTPDRRWLN